jgi:hypothetical protein
MDFVLAVFVFPALVAALAVGAGLLVDRASGRALPGVLIAPVGLAALVVVAELVAWSGSTSQLTPIALAVVGVAGYAVGLGRLRGMRLDLWPIAATVAVYLMVCAPVILSGQVTVPGYLLDTTVAFHLSGSDYLIEHGRDFARVPDSAFRRMLDNYFGTQYPSGGHTLLGGAGRLVGVERLWLYHPFMSLLLAFCAPTLYFIARAATLPRALAAAGALLASAPALVYAYAQMGAIKELTALPFVLLLGAVLVLLPRLLEAGWRGVFMPAVVVAAGIGAIGLAFLPWFGATALAGLILLFIDSRRELRQPRPLAIWTAVLAVAVVLLAIPTFGPLTESVELAESFSTGNAAAVADPGNLLRPLLNQQMFGIWLSGTHRVDPVGGLTETYFLIGVAAVAALLGALLLVRRRLWSIVAFVVVMAVVWVALTRRGTAWTDAKLLVITSPILVLLAAVGVESLRRGGRRIEAALVGGAIAAGVLLSNAYTYHDTNLQPTERYEELIEIGERFAGHQPTLTPEFDEFYFYALPDMATDSPGNAQRTERVAQLVDGTFAGYGHSYDVDQLPLEGVRQYEAIVARRRPEASRPPVGFELAFRGDYYDVWLRSGDMEAVMHQPSGSGLVPGGEVPCSRVRRIARQAGLDGTELAYVERRGVIAYDIRRLRRTKRSPGWTETVDGIGLYTPGELLLPIEVPAGGRWRIWLKGEFGREVSVSVDGQPVGSVSGETGGDGNYALPLEADLTAGKHKLEVTRGGGSPAPGDATPSRLVAIVLEPESGAEPPTVETMPPSGWRELCERNLDWIETVRPSSS